MEEATSEDVGDGDGGGECKVVEVAEARVGMVEASEAVAGRAMAAVMGAGLKAEAAAAGRRR